MTLHGDEAKTPGTQSVAFCDLATEPDGDLIREDYVFAGWYERLRDVSTLSDEDVARIVAEDSDVAELIRVDEDGSTMVRYDFDDPVVYDVVLYAMWDAVPYNVTFVVDGVVQEQLGHQVFRGYLAEAPQDPAKFGYVFTGWYTDEALAQAYDFASPVMTDLTLYAGYAVQSCTVTFNSEGGSEVASQTVEFGQHAVRPEDPTFEGHEFVGWYELVEEGVGPEDFDAYPEIREILEFWDGNAYMAFDFEGTEVQTDVVLHARWREAGQSQRGPVQPKGTQPQGSGASGSRGGAGNPGTRTTGASSRSTLPNTGDPITTLPALLALLGGVFFFAVRVWRARDGRGTQERRRPGRG